MLKTTRLVSQPSTKRLVKLWTERYIPNLSTFAEKGRLNIFDLVEADSGSGRAKTFAKLHHHLQTNSELAGIQTNALFAYVPNVVNLAEARRLSQFVRQAYGKTLEIYQQQSSSPALQAKRSILANFSSQVAEDWLMPQLELPAIEQLATMLDPVLTQLQEQHLSAEDKRAIGFITTQFHFSTKLLLEQITLPEQVLLSPYLKFVEEQICIPWQRICAAAAKQEWDSPALQVVQQLLPQSHAVAQTVYARAAYLYSNHRSRRGGLSHPGVAASTIRDMNMFQGYLFLCMLEGSMAAVEQELLPLCVMVFPSVQVSWQLVQRTLKLITDELLKRVNPEQRHLLLPYTQALEQIFSDLESTAA